MKKILIIGCGKLGSSLYLALKEQTKYRVCIHDIKGFPQEFSTLLHDTDWLPQINTSVIQSFEIIIISVPDDNISCVIKQLSGFNLNKKIILHTSGACSLDVFKSIDSSETESGSLHPIQTFPKLFCSPKHWSNIWCTFEGTSRAADSAREICDTLGAKLLPVNRGQKQTIHLAAVFVANYTVALLVAAEKILQSQGLDKQILAPLLKQVQDNFTHHPAKKILSGPIQRGDSATVKKHLDMLGESSFNVEQKLYRALAEYILTNPDFELNNIENLLKMIQSEDS